MAYREDDILCRRQGQAVKRSLCVHKRPLEVMRHTKITRNLLRAATQYLVTDKTLSSVRVQAISLTPYNKYLLRS